VATALSFVDDDGTEVVLETEDAESLFALTGGLEAATVSACPTCRSRVLACVALVDVLEDAPPLARATELLELADDAPTLHLYVEDLATSCTHPQWLDPGRSEWEDALEDLEVERRGLR
jgi:hypothetical protein